MKFGNILIEVGLVCSGVMIGGVLSNINCSFKVEQIQKRLEHNCSIGLESVTYQCRESMTSLRDIYVLRCDAEVARFMANFNNPKEVKKVNSEIGVGGG